MNDREFLLYLRILTTDELIEVLEFRETVVQLYSDLDPDSPLPLVTKSERLCSLVKSELARRGAFERDDAVARLNAPSIKLWRLSIEEQRERLREIWEDLERDPPDGLF